MMMGDKGEYYNSNICRTMKSAYHESTPERPIFLMPTQMYNKNMCEEWKKCAEEMGIKCCYLCMNTHNKKEALEMVEKAAREGYWVMIENCWWDRTMYNCLSQLKNTHKDFRFWSMLLYNCQPSHQMMCNCLKVPMEPMTEFKDTMMCLWEKVPAYNCKRQQ